MGPDTSSYGRACDRVYEPSPGGPCLLPLPGTVDALRAAGTRHGSIPSGPPMRLEPGRLADHDSAAYPIACGRHLLDHTVRQRASRPATTVRTRTSVLGLAGDASRVGGALVENRTGRASDRPDPHVPRHAQSPPLPRGLHPAEFVATGDAVTALDPVYGHGTAVAAQCASAPAVALAPRVPARGRPAAAVATIGRFPQVVEPTSPS
ncbi:hypothetical protein [Streptomyces sp. NPDC057545]|uniref:hypothetical protein n=2 Tax=unclassified Streptomyces TaxID=2593676 RepID=UPI0036A10E11